MLLLAIAVLLNLLNYTRPLTEVHDACADMYGTLARLRAYIHIKWTHVTCVI